MYVRKLVRKMRDKLKLTGVIEVEVEVEVKKRVPTHVWTYNE